MGAAPLLISVVKSNKYALLGVLGFDAKGGHITYENTYHSSLSTGRTIVRARTGPGTRAGCYWGHGMPVLGTPSTQILSYGDLWA